ncbi:LPXTG cell wall anchor domain-containing protein [Enterococcus faecalis]|uniref:LPXTG cell wall anchor domain-containing protein n=1 Tax=Enterococcus faecalis TaxID=1351 RepID=UPI003BA03767
MDETETKATLIMEENSNEIISGGNVSDLKTNYYISYNSVRTLPDTGEYNSLNYLFMGEILLILLFVLVMYKKNSRQTSQ